MNEVKLPTSILLQDRAKDETRAFYRHISKAEEAYRYLSKIKDYDLPINLEDVTLQNLRYQIETRLDAVERADYLTTAAKTEARDGWLKLRKQLEPYVEDIEALLTTYSETDFYVVNSQIRPEQDIETLIRKRNTVAVPDEATTHYKLIQDAIKVVENLRTWEQQQNLKKLPLIALRSLDENSIAEAWSNGYIKKDVTSIEADYNSTQYL